MELRQVLVVNRWHDDFAMVEQRRRALTSSGFSFRAAVGVRGSLSSFALFSPRVDALAA